MTPEARRDAFRRFMERRGLNAHAWARDAGISEGTIRNYLAGRVASLNVLTCEKLAVSAGVSPSEMFGDRSDLRPARVASADDGSPVSIPEIDVRAGMGGGGEAAIEYVPGDIGFLEADGVRDSWSIPEGYLRSELHVTPDAARIIEVQGDSMTPTLQSGDRIMIDTADRRPSPPGLFALWDGFGVIVKRVEHILNSDPPTIRIQSDNHQHSAYERTADEVNIIGRVVWRAMRV